MKKISLFFIFLLAVNIFSQELSIAELEEIVNAAERLGNVRARSHVHQYWQLADLYLQKEDFDHAYDIIIKGLQLDSWNYKYQKIASDIEIRKNDHIRAHNRLNFIINNLNEIGAIYNDSVRQLSIISNQNLNDSSPNLPGYHVYIATYPNLDPSVIDLLTARISIEYGLEVRTVNVGLYESETNKRDKQLEEYEKIIQDTYLRNPKNTIDNFLNQLGISNEEMNTYEGKRRYVYALLNQTDNGKRIWEELELVKGQYSGNALNAQLNSRFRNYLNNKYCLGILGVTSNDIYENTSNFLFGWTPKGIGVMSYARFLQGNPTSEQFEKRVVMQGFSSIGFVLGIPRCTSPNCARAYPNSLEEHDRKDDKLCTECRNNLRQLYKTL